VEALLVTFLGISTSGFLGLLSAVVLGQLVPGSWKAAFERERENTLAQQRIIDRYDASKEIDKKVASAVAELVHSGLWKEGRK
jgi:hypothetical protein